MWRPWDIPILFENAELLDIRFLGNWFKSWNFEQNFLMGMSTFLSYFQKNFSVKFARDFHEVQTYRWTILDFLLETLESRWSKRIAKV